MREFTSVSTASQSILCIVISAPLLGSQHCVDEDDADGDGYTIEEGDCDDNSATTYPGAPELCDAVNNDCDEGLDEDWARKWLFPDADHDGFGDNNGIYICDSVELTGYGTVRGDCNDSSASIHAGAIDRAGDGVDQDCGGTENAEPFVYINGNGYVAIQAAINAAESGTTVWVGPATYLESQVSFDGKPIAVKAIDLAPESTTIQSELQGQSVMMFVDQETPESVLDGFRITGGIKVDGNGAGIYVENASPTFYNLDVSWNSAGTSGSSSKGGGIYLEDSYATLKWCHIHSNDAAAGGGVYISGGAPLIEQSTFNSNIGSDTGGAIAISASSGTVIVSDCNFEWNSSSSGGAVWIRGGSVQFTNTSFSENASYYDGAAVTFLGGASADFINALAHNNVAYTDSGSAVYISDGAVTLNQTTIAGNTGNGIYYAAELSMARLVLYNSIVAHNDGYNVYRATTGALVAVDYSDVYNALYADPEDNLNHNLGELNDYGDGNIEKDPLFMEFDEFPPQDLHLSDGSPCINTGDPTVEDWDGSFSDMGAYGGPEGNW